MTTDESAGFDRLRGADPAAGTEPDLDRIHAAVAAATGVPLSGGPAARPDELAPRRRGARTRWFQVAAAVAAGRKSATAAAMTTASASFAAARTASRSCSAVSTATTSTPAPTGS
jgi:hypothetical protein